MTTKLKRRTAKRPAPLSIAMDYLELAAAMLCRCGQKPPGRRAEELAAEDDRQYSEKDREKAEQYRRKLVVELLNAAMR